MFEERKRAITREENVKFVDFKDLALQPCSLAGYVNLNYLNFPKYFPPDINFFEENLMFAGTIIQYLPVK
ncbi:hypothetical protein DSF30_05925 [Salmonella enterica subsp. enterica serovar Oranienburg]|nr:hypothetical protein [Salmonella enterica subsp. enterica serovar Oranienburg]